MNNNKITFNPYYIEQINLTIEFNDGWPLESFMEHDCGNICQLVTDTDGFVFVRYGKKETIDNFITNLNDYVTDTTKIKDKKITFCGYDARHVTILNVKKRLGMYRMDEKGDIIHGGSPEIRMIISVIGFSYQDIPILVGYRIPEANLKNYKTIIEKIIYSVSIHE